MAQVNITNITTSKLSLDFRIGNVTIRETLGMNAMVNIGDRIDIGAINRSSYIKDLIARNRIIVSSVPDKNDIQEDLYLKLSSLYNNLVGSNGPTFVQQKQYTMLVNGAFVFADQSLVDMADAKYSVFMQNHLTAAFTDSSDGPWNLEPDDTITAKVDRGAVQTLTLTAAEAVRECANAATYNLGNGKTLLVAIDGAAAQTITFAAVAAVRTSANAQSYALVDNQTLTVKINAGGVQTFTFNTASFVDIAAATAQEVVNIINATITGAVASVGAGNHITITSIKLGTGASVEVTGGTANVAFDFNVAVVHGTGDFVDASVATSTEVANAITIGITGAVASSTSGNTKVTITSSKRGTGSHVQVTGGTANAVLGFLTTLANGTGNVPNIDAVTAQDLVAVAAVAFVDLTPTVHGAKIRLTSDSIGLDSYIEVTNVGSANVGFSNDEIRGTGDEAAAPMNLRTTTGFTVVGPALNDVLDVMVVGLAASQV